MTVREQILFILKLYKFGEYSTEEFCNMFNGLYHYEQGGYKFFKGNDREWLDELAVVTERFSPFAEDIANYPDIYFDENAVKLEFDEAVKNIKAFGDILGES